MLPTSVHDKSEIAAFTSHQPLMHLFELGDLDDFFWLYTTWYAIKRDGVIRQLALLYHASTPVVLIAIPDEHPDEMRSLLQELIPVLPRRIYAHLHPGCVDVLAADYRIEPRGLLLKMGLRNHPRFDTIDTTSVCAFTTGDMATLQAFYQESYPENWFTPRMLETNRYFGLRQGNTIISVAGVHVYSPAYGAAVIGPVATHPQMRGHGLPRACCARLCQALRQDGIEHIGLNVHVDNAPAISCYTAIGFEPLMPVGTYMLTAKG
jgi:RimJ/RimL family protein N-acetyltransferase